MLDAIKYGSMLAIFVLLVYCGYLFALPQYKYYSFKSDAADIVKFHLRKTDEVKGKLLKRARELDVPIKPSNILVEKYGKKFSARIFWSEEVDIFGQYQKVFNFEVRVGEKADDIGGGMGRGRKLFL